MTRIQADPSLQDALARNGQSVEVCDEQGRLIGYAVSAAEMKRLREADRLRADLYASPQAQFDPEELRAAAADPRRYTTEDVLKLVEDA